MKGHTYSNGHAVWNVEDLWKAAEGLEAVLLPLDEVTDIEELLDSHTWSAGPLSVREILDHVNRIENADLSYPIVLTPEGFIGDGCHRLIKAWRRGHKFVPVVRLETMPLPVSYEV